MQKIYRVGTRKSPLALKQVGEVLDKLKGLGPDFKFEIIEIDTLGDKDKVTSIVQMEGSDFFTKEIDSALLNEDIDLAVHSAKDLPEVVKDGLTIAAITKSIEGRDVLVSKNNLELSELKNNAKIGTSSARRKKQLKQYRCDFQIVDIRGNIQERLDKLYSSRLDAILIAAAGLIRLGLADKISQYLPKKIIEPHPLQGALAVVIRKNESGLLNLLKNIDTREIVYL